MELFKPSKKMLESITSGELDIDVYNPLITYEIITNQYKGLDISLIPGVVSRIENYYGLGYSEQSRARIDMRTITYPFLEIIKNSIAHSPNGRNKLEVGYFFGDRGVCLGFNDYGDYFKDEKIKYQYENKIKVTEFDPNPYISCSNKGTRMAIFPCADKIEVDSDRGIIYFAKLRENLIAPEGEHGASYFYERRNKK